MDRKMIRKRAEIGSRLKFIMKNEEIITIEV